jgi:hypothetical protein
MIAYPRPEAFVQSIRLRRRGLPPTTAILVVEGITDKRALFPFLAPDVVVVPADGKDKLIRTFEELEAELRPGVLFLLDCDGGIEQRLKGHLDLIITTNRDLEADLMFELRALERVAYEHLSSFVEAPGDLEPVVSRLLADASVLTAMIGIVQGAAVRLGFSMRVIDARTGDRRRLRLTDLQPVRSWLNDVASLELRDVANVVGQVVGWPRADKDAVSIAAEEVGIINCARHDEVRCFGCWKMSHCNGHLLTQATALAFDVYHRVRVDVKDLDRALRIAADTTLIPEWDVARRIRRWEQAQKCNILLRGEPGLREEV